MGGAFLGTDRGHGGPIPPNDVRRARPGRFAGQSRMDSYVSQEGRSTTDGVFSRSNLGRKSRKVTSVATRDFDKTLGYGKVPVKLTSEIWRPQLIQAVEPVRAV